MKQVLDDFEEQEKRARYNRASKQISGAMPSGRFSVMPKKFVKAAAGVSAEDAAAQAQKAAREEREAEELE